MRRVNESRAAFVPTTSLAGVVGPFAMVSCALVRNEGIPVVCLSQPVLNLVAEPWEPLVAENGWLMIITGYIDESYDGKDYPDDFTLCCVMLSADDWKEVISPRWRELFARVNQDLDRQGRKKISRYKAADCNGSYGEFEGWSRDEKLALTKQMSEVFDHSELKLSQLAYSVHLSKIHQKIPSVKDPKSFAYAMLFLLIVKGILDMMDVLPQGSTISFIHDRCDFDQVYLCVFDVALRTANADQRAKLTTIASMPNENCPPLEVADLIAYENYKMHMNRAEGKDAKRTLDYLREQQRLGGRSSWLLDEQFTIDEHTLDVLKWCSSHGGKHLRYPELDARP